MKYLILLLFLLCFAGCKYTHHNTEFWGKHDNKDVYLYTLTNDNGVSFQITNYGGRMVSLMVPDREGKLGDVLLGFDNLEQYTEPNPAFGMIVGRYANRIRNAQFSIDSTTYNLTKNAGEHSIHGGGEFGNVVWDGELVTTGEEPALKLHYISPNGSHGFPGTLDCYVTYTLTADNSVKIKFEATTDKATHVNMSSHAYFNLSALKSTIVNHLVRMNADRYTVIDEDIVPTGEIDSVIGKDWDLTKEIELSENINKLNHGGYHYNYVFNKPIGLLEEVLSIREPKSGRTLTVSTTQPGVQFYTGNAISDTFVGKYNIRYGKHMGLCLETQHFPDSPNHGNFPSSLLLPDEKYEEVVIYKFGVE
ncbi:aldose epimerase family protein [Reichenbachiella versicolor]|uniref:aldose epimerase family protein n=1 Tax=Reichenbachiella versicolor TaxID=1821036 RepID=UPI000D6E7665|nr:aldose epimerase family protein [Reichenbachiella versicolor]